MKTLIAVLGITAGVTAAALDVMAAYLWRPLPYPSAERLAVVNFPRANGPSPLNLQRIDWSGLSDFAELTVAGDVDAFTVIGADVPFSVDGRWMSADAFAAVGAVAAVGRFFTVDEVRRGEAVAVIGYRVWQDHYGGDPAAIGRSLTARATLRQGQSENFTIVGVLPPKFWHLEEQTNLILPLKGSGTPMVLRLRPGVSFEEAAIRVTAIVRTHVPGVGADWRAGVRPAQEAHVDRIRPMLAATGWGVLLLGAVALANLAFLQMARGVGRQREMAVRTVLGASRRQLTREVLVEGLRTGAWSSLVAVAIAAAITRLGVPAVERYLGRIMPGETGRLGLEPVMWAGVAAACVSAALALAVVMLVASRGGSLRTALAGHPGSTDTPARLLARQVIVGSQVAVAFCLLVSAVLMIRTAWHLGQLDLGFEPRGVLSANVTLHEGTYRSLAERKRFFTALIERLEQIPGIEHAGLTGWLPFRIGPAFGIEPEGPAAQASAGASIQPVNPQYFQALQMPLLEGRPFTPADRDGTERVAVISRALARTLWPSESALGHAFRVRFSSAEPGRPGFGPFTIVGVVEDSLRSLVDPTPPQVYMPFDQQPLASNAFLQVKTSGQPMQVAPVIARVLHDADPNVPLAAVRTLDDIVGSEGVRPVFLARVLSGFSALAVVMALVGLYAVSSWIAQQRQREAALRVALGAGRKSVALLLARRGLLAIAGGLLAGWWVAGPLATLLSSELHGISAADWPTRAITAGVLFAISAFTLWRPIWRAATFNPASLLRSD